jgi:hypothetical protein
MMTLYEKIMALYPDLPIQAFGPGGTIVLQDDSDGKGPYLAKWEYPGIPRPTDEQLEGA